MAAHVDAKLTDSVIVGCVAALRPMKHNNGRWTDWFGHLSSRDSVFASEHNIWSLKFDLCWPPGIGTVPDFDMYVESVFQEILRDL